jgi:molecular chaperone DnaJ
VKRDYYQVLEIDRTASDDDIKKAYRKLALKYHPDKNPGDAAAESKFKEAAEAYEVLREKEKRAVYDRFGHDGLRAGSAPRGFSNFEDIFSAFSEIFGGDGSPFGDMFSGGGGRRSGGGRRGASLRCEVAIDLGEVAAGVVKTIEVRRLEHCDACGGTGSKKGSEPKPCRTCHGRGEVMQSNGFLTIRTTCPRCQGAGSVVSDPCSTCRGAGRRDMPVKLDLTIPAGIEDGTQIRVSGQGEAGEGGAPRGDLYCVVRVREHAIFRRRGDDLVVEMPLSFTQAALGTEIEVPTLDGPLDKLKIPHGTQTGEVFKMRGRGLPRLHAGVRGHLLVQVVVEVPKKLTPAQETLLHEYAKTESRDTSPRRKGLFEKVKEYFE